jgi:AraC family transcriptional regulator
MVLSRISELGARVKTPERTTAAAFSRYAAGEVVADSGPLQWKGLFVRRYRFPRVVDRFLVPATPEPLISCGISGAAEFREREIGETWVTRQIGRGHIFVTRSKAPYEVSHTSPVGEELEIVQVHVAVDQFLPALEAAYPRRRLKRSRTDPGVKLSGSRAQDNCD